VKLLALLLIRLASIIAIGTIVLPSSTDFWTAFAFYFALIVFSEMTAQIAQERRPL
jgi:hypothetical protein